MGKCASWKAFEYSFYLRGGGISNEGLDLNYLSFSNGDWQYLIYQEYSAATNSTAFGIRLICGKDNQRYDMPGIPDSASGSLVLLRDNDEIQNGEIPVGF